MGKLCDLFRKKQPEEPSGQLPGWIHQTRDEIASAELEAAATHYTWMTLIEDGTLPAGYEKIGGDYDHHVYWWQKHREAAWLCSPEYCEKRGL